jgi:type II secretory pathway predicted ATPase ExeA
MCVMYMRMKIDIDDGALREAQRLTGIQSPAWPDRHSRSARKSALVRRLGREPSRPLVIAVDTRVRGIHHRIVASPGGQPLTHHATLAPQAADALAAEQAEQGRTPVMVVEEAHLSGHDHREALRLLTNHELDSSSPFVCLLVGQPTPWR